MTTSDLPSPPFPSPPVAPPPALPNGATDAAATTIESASSVNLDMRILPWGQGPVPTRPSISGMVPGWLLPLEAAGAPLLPEHIRCIGPPGTGNADRSPRSEGERRRERGVDSATSERPSGPLPPCRGARGSSRSSVMRALPGCVTSGSFIVAAALASAQSTIRVSVDSTGSEGDSKSSAASISADGRVVAFASAATNLVAGDTNGAGRLRPRPVDRRHRARQRRLGGQRGRRQQRRAERLGGRADRRLRQRRHEPRRRATRTASCDVFVHDRVDRDHRTRQRRLVGRAGERRAATAARSPRTATSSRSRATPTNLVAGDTNGCHDVFVHDRPTGTTERVSVDSSGAEGERRTASPRRSRRTGRSSRSRAPRRTSSPATRTARADVFVHDRVDRERPSASASTRRARRDDGEQLRPRRSPRTATSSRSRATRRTSSRATRTAYVGRLRPRPPRRDDRARQRRFVGRRKRCATPTSAVALGGRPDRRVRELRHEPRRRRHERRRATSSSTTASTGATDASASTRRARRRTAERTARRSRRTARSSRSRATPRTSSPATRTGSPTSSSTIAARSLRAGRTTAPAFPARTAFRP